MRPFEVPSGTAMMRLFSSSEQMNLQVGLRPAYELAVNRFRPGLHPDIPTLALTADQSTDAASGSRPVLPSLRTFGKPLMLPSPLGPM